MITRNALLDLMVSRTAQSSGTEAEAILADAKLVRAADELAALELSSLDALWAKAPSLRRLALAAKGKSAGMLLCQCLREYEAFRATPERALARVYTWANSVDPKLYPLGKPGLVREAASELYADCLIVLSDFVTSKNRKQIRRVV